MSRVLTRPAPPVRLRIRLLGEFGIEVDGDIVAPRRWRLRKARALVAMLALAPGQVCRKDQVLDRLWPELEAGAAGRNLHQTLYVARRALGEVGVGGLEMLAMRGDQVALMAGGSVAVDVLEFETQAGLALASLTEADLRAAADLYRGDLLPDSPDAPWLTGRRAELATTSREVMVKLASTIGRTHPEEALVILTRLLEADPLHEVAVRHQMLLLAGLGRRTEALASYERLVAELLETHGTDPDPQTKALFKSLLTDPATTPGDASPQRATEANGERVLDADWRGSFPVQVSTFVGRERELRDVARLLADTRVLTLTGTGGCGKTRLALQAAQQAAAKFSSGAWFVDLGPVEEASLVPDAVSATLRLDSAPGSSRLAALAQHLRSATVLLVLDNCEHLLSSCAQVVATLTAACPGVSVLATSREPLHTSGEVTFRVPSLALPPVSGVGDPDLAELARHSSVRLFVERASSVRPGFALTSTNAHGIVELCRQLDGIPLALELAAARIAVLEPAEIVRRLGETLSILGRAPGGLTRHQTLRAALEWSHDLLTDHERVLLRRLSIFSSGFSLEAVEAVCAAPPLDRDGLFELLAHLVDKSLVVAETTGTETRYRQLEIVRQFAREHSNPQGDDLALAAAHCSYFVELAVRHNPEQATGTVIEQPRRLDRDHDNLRAALRWACVHDPQAALLLAASLWRFWFVRGHSVEGATWVTRALDAAPGATRPRAAALIGLAALDGRQGRSDRHLALSEEALEIMREIGDAEEIRQARLAHATIAWGLFNLGEAERLALALREESMTAGAAEYVAASSWLLGNCALSREDGPSATEHLIACLTQLGAVPATVTPFLPVITPSLYLVPMASRLVPCFEETMLGARRVGADVGTGYVLAAIGDAARLSPHADRAVASIREAIERFAHIGDDLARGQALHQLGCLQRSLGEFDEARASLSAAREIRTGMGDRRGQLLTEGHLALIHTARGDRELGLAEAAACLASFESAGDRVGMGAALTILGSIHLIGEDLVRARSSYSRAAELLGPWRRHAGWSHLMAAELSADLGESERAQRDAAASGAAFDTTRGLVADQRLRAVRRRLARIPVEKPLTAR